MNDELLSAVKQIIAKDGEAALDDAQRVNSFLADLAKDAPKPVKTAFVKCLEQGYAKIVKAAREGERASTRQKLAMRLHEEEGLDTKRCYEALTVLEAALFGSAEEGVFAEAKPKATEAKPAPNANPLVGTWFAENYTDNHYYLYIEKPDTATLDAYSYFDSAGHLLTARYDLTISVNGSQVTLNRKSGLNILKGEVFSQLIDRQLSDFSLELNANGTELKGTSQGGMNKDWTFTKVATKEKEKVIGEEDFNEVQVAPVNPDAEAITAQGYTASEAGDYAKALELWRKAADMGSSRANVGIGFAYYSGQGVPQDYAKALELFRKAADMGNASAIKNIGVFYEKGIGVQQDKAKALKWYKKLETVDSAAGKEAIDNLLGTNSSQQAPSTPRGPTVYQRGMISSILIGAIGGIGIGMTIGWIYLLLTGAYSFPGLPFVICLAIGGFFTFKAWRNRQNLFYGLLAPALFGWLVMFGIVPEHVRGPYAPNARSEQAAPVVTTLDEFPAEFIGTWVNTTGPYAPYTLTIDNNRIEFMDIDKDFVRYTDVVLTETTSTIEDYPTAYTMTGELEQQGYSWAVNTGIGFIALSADKSSIYLGITSTSAFSPNTASPYYTKQ